MDSLVYSDWFNGLWWWIHSWMANLWQTYNSMPVLPFTHLGPQFQERKTPKGGYGKNYITLSWPFFVAFWCRFHHLRTHFALKSQHQKTTKKQVRKNLTFSLPLLVAFWCRFHHLRTHFALKSQHPKNHQETGMEKVNFLPTPFRGILMPVSPSTYALCPQIPTS